MARCYCRWRNVFICVCSPCICLAVLFIYVAVMLCAKMNATGSLQNLHFIAKETINSENIATVPKTFWDHLPHNNGFWNQLQLTIDRYFNPILCSKNCKRRLENSNFAKSPLKHSFSEVTDLDSMKEKVDKLPQHLQEFVNYMQRRDYPIVLQPHGTCGAQDKDERKLPLLLLAIKTMETNFKNRQVIRQTWGQVGWVAARKRNSIVGEESGGYVRRVFLLGKENIKEMGLDLSELLEIENKHYGDILQWDFEDTFFNLTLKDVLFWDWFSRFCHGIRFVFKGDDDVFVNTPNVITYLQDQLEKPQAHKTMKDFMVGDVIGAALPNQANDSKYFIPHSFYKGLYPVYAGGGGVVYSGLLTKRLHQMSKRVHLFPIDDVYVGMCMARLNAQPIHHPAFLTFDFPEKKELCSYHTILLVHKRSPHEVIKLWADLKKTQAQCQNVPLRAEVKKEKSSMITTNST